MTARRRHDPVTLLPLLQERFWRLVREHAPRVFDELAAIEDSPRDDEVLAWATRFGLVGVNGLQPEWCHALTLRTLQFWRFNPADLRTRSLLPWRILDIWNTDTVPRGPAQLPFPNESSIVFRHRQQKAVVAHEADLVQRGLAVVDRGGTDGYLLALVKHNCLGLTWETIAANPGTDERNLRREVRALADRLGFASGRQ